MALLKIESNNKKEKSENIFFEIWLVYNMSDGGKEPLTFGKGSMNSSGSTSKVWWKPGSCLAI